MNAGGRLVSLDALRGFDMLFIMGGGGLITAICAALGCPDGAFARQFRHVEWAGLRFEDTIFPLFLFIAGVSFPFSSAKRLADGASRASLYCHAVRRGLTLILLGLIVNSLLKFDFANLRYYGVLQFIGFTWAVAACLYLSFGVRTRAAIAAVLLVGSWLFFRFCTSPDFPGADPFSPEGNLGCWFDRAVIGSNHVYKKGLFDPEGAATVMPGIVTPMLGMFAGELLRSGFSSARKVVSLLAAAVAMVATGLLLSLSQPVVKALWSSSFVLVAGGYSAAMLAIFYWIVDVKGWRRWTFFFTVIGMNSITIYMAQCFVGFRGIAKYFFGGAISFLPQALQGVANSAAYILTCWLFLLFLYRHKIFFKV